MKINLWILALALLATAGVARAAVDWTAAPSANDLAAVGNALGQLAPARGLAINAGSARLDSGTTFTVAVAGTGCAVGTGTGGAAAGKFTATTGGTCTFTVTLGGGATATTGWVGTAADLTTTGDLLHQTGSTTTTIVFAGTVVTGDVLTFGATGY